MHPLYEQADRLSRQVIGAAIEVHRHLGPGLLESIYQKCLHQELALRGLEIGSQQSVRIDYKGLTFTESLRCDLLINDCLLVELKAVQEIQPIHKAQLLSYLKLMDLPLGLLLNFHACQLREGVIRLLLPHAPGSIHRKSREAF